MTFSRKYPAYHPKAGEPTFFVEKFWNSFNVQALGEIFLYDGSDSETLRKLNKHLFLYDILDTFKMSLKESKREDLGAKFHTIRKGKRWKEGDYFSPRVWGNDVNPKSGKSGPYHSKQIIIAPDTVVKKVWDVEVKRNTFFINKKPVFKIIKNDFTSDINHPESVEAIAKNDGLNGVNLLNWFKFPKPFSGQIICWGESIEY